MAGLYSYYLAPLILTPAQVNIPQLVNTGNRLGGWLLVQNNSPYKIQVNLPGSANYLPLDPQTVDKIQVNTGDQQVYILPLTLLPGAAPSSQIDIQVYPGPDPENEPPGTYPMALTRQAAPTSRASDVGYTTGAAFAPPASQGAGINLFNPSTSGIIATIFAARITIVVFGALGVQTPTIEFGFNAGADNAFGAAGNNNPNPNDTGGSISLLKGSAAVNVSVPGGSTIWEAFQPTATGADTIFIYDFIPFPDQKKLRPGTNAWIIIFNVGAAGILVGFALKHTEQ